MRNDNVDIIISKRVKNKTAINIGKSVELKKQNFQQTILMFNDLDPQK